MIGRETYRNPVRKGRIGSSCARKKNVPESGTQRKSRIKLRSEEERTGIRYAKRSWIKLHSEEECTEIRYTKEKFGSSCNRKKNVPESGTRRKNRIELQSEEKRTGIRYAKEEPDQAAIGRRTYRNPVRKGRAGSSCDRKKNVPESGTHRKVQNESKSKAVLV